MPENYGQGYGGGHPSQPQQPQQMHPSQQMPGNFAPQTGGQPPYEYGGYPQQNMPQPQQNMPQQMPYGYSSGQQPKKGLGIGAIIGIVVGALAIVGLLLFFAIGVLMVDRSDNQGTDSPSTATSTPSDDDSTDDMTIPSLSDEDEVSGSEINANTDPVSSPDQDDTTTDAQGGSTSPSLSTTVDINNLSNDWFAGEINLSGAGYRLFESTYSDLVANGWGLSKYSQDQVDANNGSMIINAGTWTTFQFENPSFPGYSLTVGLGNVGDAPINYDQGVITYFDGRVFPINGSYDYEGCYDLTISKGIHLGMTDGDIITAFGMPDENGGVTEDDGSGFKAVRYSVVSEGQPFSRSHLNLTFNLRLDNGQYRIYEIIIGT